MAAVDFNLVKPRSGSKSVLSMVVNILEL